MNAATPNEPEKANAPRFLAVGVRPDTSKPFDWYVVDRGPCEVLGGVEIAHCEADETTARERAERIAFALNLVGRLLGDPGKPYYVDEVERMAEALEQISAQCSARAVQAMGMGEGSTAVMFGAEARAIGAGADVVRRMLAELLKFALVGDSAEVRFDSWFDAYNPDRDEPGYQPNHLRDAFVAGAQSPPPPKHGPYTSGKCDLFAEGMQDGAAVFDAEGQPFCLVDGDTVLGGDPLPRAAFIAGVLNRAEAGQESGV